MAKAQARLPEPHLYYDYYRVLVLGSLCLLLTLTLQESFKQRGAWRRYLLQSIFPFNGGTFGITILGVIMNHTSSGELGDQINAR